MIKSLVDLAATLQRFADERDWEQFHSPKNLAMALSVEVAELAEHFQWLTQQQSMQLSDEQKQAVGEELADACRSWNRLKASFLSQQKPARNPNPRQLYSPPSRV